MQSGRRHINLLEASDTWHYVVHYTIAGPRFLGTKVLNVEADGREERSHQWRRDEWIITCLLGGWCGQCHLSRTTGLYFVYPCIPQHLVQVLIWKRCSLNWVGILPVEWTKDGTGRLVLDSVIIGSDRESITRETESETRKQSRTLLSSDWVQPGQGVVGEAHVNWAPPRP